MIEANLATRLCDDRLADGVISWDPLASLTNPLAWGVPLVEIRSVAPLVIEPWRVQLSARIRRLVELPPNWDSYGATPVSRDFLRYALEVLSAIMRPGTPPPALIPTSVGGVQIEWHTRGIDLEIGVESTSRIHVSYEDHRDGVEWEGELTSDLTELDRFISELSRRKS